MSQRFDDTGFGNIKIKQNIEEFCYGVDAVLLASFAAEGISRGGYNRVIDLGTGTGIIPLILSHKTTASYIAGIEVQEKSFITAVENVADNGLKDRLVIINEDVYNISNRTSDKITYGDFDVVTSNPPYTRGNGGILGKNVAKAIARHETTANLEDFIRGAAALLKENGEFYMVHRPSRLVDICALCRQYKLEPKELQFISGKPMEKPNILLVKCVKNGRHELKLRNTISVHKDDGTYTDEIVNLYEM